MGDFDPNKHLTDLKGKKYLETRWRIVWMRDEHPNWRIGTEVLSYEPPLVKATVYDDAGAIVATGHGGANDKGNAVWSGRTIEKAETAAIGRALGHAGYGTQFLASEGDNLADSPVDYRSNRPANNNNRRPPATPPTSVTQAAQTNGGTVTKREKPVEAGDLRDKDVAGRFIQHWRSQLLSDGEVLAALGVTKLSEWTKGKKAADAAVDAWLAGRVTDKAS